MKTDKQPREHPQGGDPVSYWTDAPKNYQILEYIPKGSKGEIWDTL